MVAERWAMEEEIQMLESYFCQSGEFTKEVEYNSANACSVADPGGSKGSKCYT